jgi:hypothetical protein
MHGPSPNASFSYLQGNLVKYLRKFPAGDFTAETQSSQRSENCFTKNSLLRDLSASAVNILPILSLRESLLRAQPDT